MYRLLARRWQSRLNALLSQQQELEQGENDQQQHRAAEDLFNVLDSNNAVLVRVGDRSNLSGLRAMIQEQLREADNGEEDEVNSASEDEGGAIDMEEDHSEVDEEDEEPEEGPNDQIDDEDELLELLADENESMMSGRDRNNSVVMEDVDDFVSTDQRRADQPRTVSVSSYDV